MSFSTKESINVSREYVELQGTTFVGEVEVDIDVLVRHLDSLGFTFEEDDCVIFESSVVDGVVYRQPRASPSAKFGDSRELKFTVCDGSVTVECKTIYFASELNESVHVVLEDLPIEIESGIAGYSMAFFDNDFQELRMATTHSECLEERDDSVIYDDGEFNVKILPDLTAYPEKRYSDENEVITKLLDELNRCLEI